MIRSLMGLLGWSSERVAPTRRAALGLESLDGRVMPAGGIATPKLFLAAIAEPPGPRDGEIPTAYRHAGEESPQRAASPQAQVSLNVCRNAGEEIPSFM
jgi:hypothetical protein